MSSVLQECSVALENWKGLTTDIGLDEPIVLVGKNGSGKSAVLHAVEAAITGGVSGIGRQASAIGTLTSGMESQVSVSVDGKQYFAQIGRKNGKYVMSKETCDRDLRVPLFVQSMLTMTDGEISKLVAPVFEGTIKMEEFKKAVLLRKPDNCEEIYLRYFLTGEVASQDLAAAIEVMDAAKRATQKNIRDLESAIKEIESITPESELEPEEVAKLEENQAKATQELVELKRQIASADSINSEINSAQVRLQQSGKEAAQLMETLRSMEERLAAAQPKQRYLDDLAGQYSNVSAQLSELTKASPFPTEQVLEQYEADIEVVKAAYRRCYDTLCHYLNPPVTVLNFYGLAEGLDELKRIGKDNRIDELSKKVLSIANEMEKVGKELSGAPNEEDLQSVKEKLESKQMFSAGLQSRLQQLSKVDADESIARQRAIEEELSSIKEKLAQHREVQAQKTLRLSTMDQYESTVRDLEPMKEVLKAAKHELAKLQDGFSGAFEQAVSDWCEICGVPAVDFNITEKGAELICNGRPLATLSGGEKILVMTGVLVAINIALDMPCKVVLVEGAELDADNLRKLCKGFDAYRDKLDIALTTSIKPVSDLAIRTVLVQ